MRNPLRLTTALLLALTGGLTALPAHAQPTPAPAKPPAAAKPAAKPATLPPVPATAPAPAVIPPTPSSAATTPAQMPSVPAAPPAAPVLPPTTAVPSRPSPAPGPANIAADAPGAATTLPDGLRITFGPGRADLNPTTADAVRALARAPSTTTFTVTTFASGAADDLSSARRVSLARGLAIRSLLINEGIASTRIYVKALGEGTDEPRDRADITLQTPPKPAP